VLAQNGFAIAGLPWFALSAQIIGLVAAWVTRRSEGSAHQTCCQRVFVGSLLLVGLTTIACVSLGAGYWLCCGTTLSIMVVGATCEFSRRLAFEADEWSGSGI